MTMYTEPLNEERLADIRRGPGAYRIWSGDEQLLWVGSSIDNVKRALRHVYLSVSEGKLTDDGDTEAHRYLELYAERYPVESLRFNYTITTRGEAKAQRDQWLDEYEAEHPGQLPPLTKKR
jgi:hypothetical protein